MILEELEPYPEEITTRLNVKNFYILDDFTFRGAGVAGQDFSVGLTIQGVTIFGASAAKHFLAAAAGS